MRRTVIAIALSFTALACADDSQPSQPLVLVDTSDTVFGWDCKGGSCDLVLLDETPPPPACGGEQEPIYSYAWARFINLTSACASDGSWSATVDDGRYLACEVDTDCPQLDFFKNPAFYECSANLCQNVDVERYPRDTIRRSDALYLCFADVPRGEPPIIPPEFDDHCGPEPYDPCSLPLPEPCWQP